MRRKRDTREDIEREIGRDVRRIMEGEEVRDIQEEEGPTLVPGMTDAGIGSEIKDARTRSPYYENEYSPEDYQDRKWKYEGRQDEAYEEEYYEKYRNEHAKRDAKYNIEDDTDSDWIDEEERAEEDGEYLGGYPADGEGDISELPERPRPGRKHGPYLFIAISFGLIFLLLSAHLIYFNISLKDDILASPYNRRQNAQAERVRRGRIMSIDGATLARTDTYDGVEERVYPYANVFAHVVGFTTHGKSGLESAANYQLLTSHTNIIDQAVNEFLKKKSDGDTVVSTLNASLQEAAYYALGDYRGAVVCINPKTGAILAMVSKPNFDPNTLADVWDEMVADPTNSNLVNRATQGLYPPGSTFKIATALAYYRRYHSFGDFQYDCKGELTIDDYTVHCYKGTVHGQEDFTSAFAHSCNTAFSEIGLRLGASALNATAGSLMFGESLPSELLSSKSRWSLTGAADDTELVQTAFGQGKTLVTPYHMALITSAIANGGVLMKPYLIDHIESASGELISSTKSAVYRKLLSPDEAQALSGLMEAAVEEGSASALSGRSYRVAGKTGSAEFTKSGGEVGTHSWFVGFVNPGDSELAIAVIAEEGGAGSSTAVPIASEILAQYYGW